MLMECWECLEICSSQRSCLGHGYSRNVPRIWTLPPCKNKSKYHRLLLARTWYYQSHQVLLSKINTSCNIISNKFLQKSQWHSSSRRWRFSYPLHFPRVQLQSWRCHFGKVFDTAFLWRKRVCRETEKTKCHTRRQTECGAILADDGGKHDSLQATSVVLLAWHHSVRCLWNPCSMGTKKRRTVQVSGLLS